ncbi:phosphotransferase [Mycolicibacterium cosmeticum]|uniref:Phosphotransferase family protein n=1 Tax=Mycolicibacterium cosmeticum TaxID=258533 RepID=W9AYY2_MYCCO|nr:phosphotransferase [Mycolicibacterium cosmeticum]CDO07796.1 phosphotransferase family protein [Mycolicibacterium cosmeticum]
MEPVQRRDPDEGAAPLSGRAVVTVDGDIVTKLHAPGTDPQALRQRLRVAARCPELLTPLSVDPEPRGDRWVTRWPRVEVVAQRPVDLPWYQAGRLLARLHHEPLGELPALAAPPAARQARPTLVHGDFHLGQLGHTAGQWVLIDIDDLAVGDPAWDLARPAGFWAAGMIPDADWYRFVDGYRAGAGPAIPPGDPWPVLEPFARAAVLAAAARHPEDPLLAAACARMD